MTHWLLPEQAYLFAQLATTSLALSLRDIVTPEVRTARTHNALMAAGSNFAGMPAALAVLQPANEVDLRIISLTVAGPFRRIGLARELLIWLQTETQRLGFTSLSLSYPLGHSSTPAMKKLTAGWQNSPGLRLVTFDRAGGVALTKRLKPVASRWLGSGRFSLVRWESIDSDLRYLLELRQQEAPPWSWPDRDDMTLGQRDDMISQVLVDQEDGVVGWLIAHRVGQSLFRVTQWWVATQWQGRGLALLLLRQAVIDALQAQPSYLSGSFGVAHDSKAMLQLCSQHLEPLASRVQSNQRACWTNTKS